MGLSLSPVINGKKIDSELGRSDGKSLAQYYMSYKINSLYHTGDILGLSGGISDEVSESKIYEGTNCPGEKNIAWAMKSIDNYIVESDVFSVDQSGLGELEDILKAIKAWIENGNGSYLAAMGGDISTYKEGAIEDCNYILRAIEMARKINGQVSLSLG
jgi:hypothetical protein